MDTGDHVVIVNASKIVLTKGKADSELVHDYSGYPGGLRTQTYGNLLSRKPEDAIRRIYSWHVAKGPTWSTDDQEAQGACWPRARSRSTKSKSS